MKTTIPEETKKGRKERMEERREGGRKERKQAKKKRRKKKVRVKNFLFLGTVYTSKTFWTYT